MCIRDREGCESNRPTRHRAAGARPHAAGRPRSDLRAACAGRVPLPGPPGRPRRRGGPARRGLRGGPLRSAPGATARQRLGAALAVRHRRQRRALLPAALTRALPRRRRPRRRLGRRRRPPRRGRASRTASPGAVRPDRWRTGDAPARRLGGPVPHRGGRGARAPPGERPQPPAPRPQPRPIRARPADPSRTVKEKTMNLDTLLRDSAAVPDAAPRVLISGRSTLDAAITAAGAQRVAAIRVIRQRRRRRLSVTALVAAAAAFAFVIAPTLSLGGKAPVSAASAAQVMRQAAAAAGAQPGGWPDAAYWHSVSTYHQGSGSAHQREAWIGHTAPGVLTDDGVDTGFIPLDEAVFLAGGRGLSWDELYALPTDSVALERNLRAGIGGVGNLSLIH